MRVLLAAAAVTCWASCAEAQSLADAARRAEEARKAAGAPSIAFDMRDLDAALAKQELLGVRLDATGWRRFLEADRALGRALVADAPALGRLKALEVSTIRDFEKFLHKDAALAASLAAAGVPPREYAGAHLAMLLAIQEGRHEPAAIAALPPAVKANIGFVAARDREIKTLTVPPVKLALRIVTPPPAPVVPAPAVPTSARPAAALVPSHAPPPPVRPAAAGDPIDREPGAEIPDFAFVDFTGTTRRLADFRGKHVMLDFWGSWCPPCRAEIPFARDAYARFRARGFEIIGMDYERGASVEQVRAYLQQNGVTWTFARPDSVRSLIVDRFRVNSFPTIVLLDPDGRVMDVHESALRGRALTTTLDRVLPK